ncbi:MAG: hypothetical protein CVU59_12505, partial [Deltaproteobacteria bacterium HGW-Deltaproteobacteria-17]
VALGPGGSGLIRPEAILSASPLLIACLGWVGLMIGFQGRWELLQRLPRGILTIVAADAAATVCVIGTIAVFTLMLWTGWSQPWPRLIVPTALLVSASLGWAMETRSFTGAKAPAARPVALAIRLTGGLSAIGAIVILGIAVSFVGRGSHPILLSGSEAAGTPGAWTEVVFTRWAGVGNLLLVAALAALTALIGRFAIGAAASASGAQGSGGDQLAVFLGLVTLAAGLAAQLGASPLLSAMVTGLVIANISTPHLLGFERFIIKAEHILAVLIFLLAGLLLNPRISWAEVFIAGAVALARAAYKPWLFAGGFARLHAAGEHGAASAPGGSAGILRFGCNRQSPVAAPLALSVVLLDPSEFHRSLLTIVVLIGLFSALLAITFSAWRRRMSARPGASVVEGAS